MTQESWDVELTPAGVKKLSPRDRGTRARTSLLRKVELTEHWAREGFPDGIKLITNRTALRSWFDPDLRLWKWTDPAVDHPRGKNRILHERFVEALRAIQNRQGTRRRARDGGATVNEAMHQALLLDNARLLDEVLSLRERVVRAEAASRRQVR